MSKLLEQINTTKTTKRLGDLVWINQSTLNGNFPHKEIEYIDTASVTKNHFEKPQILNTEEAPSRAKRLLKDGDTILSTVRPNLCHYGFIKNPKPNAVASTGFAVLTPKNIDPFYLYSYLTQDSITATLSSIAEATTTTFPAFRPEVLSEMEIEIPDLPTQKKIAGILSAYDSKIENNNKIIKNLEATAQTIFNEWFVNFHFPGYEKVKMVESEVGEIPEGWEVKPLDEIAEFLNGVASQKYPAEDVNNSLPVIKIREMNSGIDKNSDRATKNIDSKYIIKNGDILFAWSGSLSLMVWVGGEGVLNQHIFKVAPENYSRWFIYYWTNKHLQNFKTIAEGKATTLGHIQRHHLTESKVIISDKSLLNKANTILGPIFEQQILLQEENISLKQSRDQLLAGLI